jgi:hypothetical protein
MEDPLLLIGKELDNDDDEHRFAQQRVVRR